MKQDNVDIIIVSYYTGDILLECIDKVFLLENLNNIILVNNGNPPEMNKTLSSKLKSNDNLILLEGHGNIGFSAGCNLGAKQSTAKYLLFLNPDCIITDKQILSKLIAPIENGEYTVSTCKILNKDGSVQKTCRRNLMTPSIAVSASLNLYKLSKMFKPINLPINEIENLPDISIVPALSGAVVFTTKKYYKEIGGFSPEYFLHVEDMDFSMKVHAKGDKIAFVKNAEVTHYLSTSNTTNKFLEKHKAKGFIIYIQKFFPAYRGMILGGVFKALI
jgi:N-acetylglucosaminyl-diphospho-decaprenol L-rhamnosyltransferase